jgi:hypothetical protein
MAQYYHKNNPDFPVNRKHQDNRIFTKIFAIGIQIQIQIQIAGIAIPTSLMQNSQPSAGSTEKCYNQSNRRSGNYLL